MSNSNFETVEEAADWLAGWGHSIEQLPGGRWRCVWFSGVEEVLSDAEIMNEAEEVLRDS